MLTVVFSLARCRAGKRTGRIGLWAILGLGLSGVGSVLRLSGAQANIDVPALHGFNITGGLNLTPEFAALLIGLVVNSSATIAEIVRSGIQSVPAGQWESARSLGLQPGKIMRLVILPQALRVIIPLMTSSYLDLTKNSSLAVAIGFPDLVSVLNTTANQSGQVLEALAIIMVSYLTLNLAVSAIMNRYNQRIESRGFFLR
ncbi:ABC transporter permease subunit [Phyllobacterium endophyticum]|uniref:ABC transporter permease subunit n=1 Tax=Phyllobacterium endophyticum TaxID=1149773 RepID=UPI00248493F5|nr:ABC transporter permease subunit [Phyllobacterium endophyticum]